MDRSKFTFFHFVEWKWDIGFREAMRKWDKCAVVEFGNNLSPNKGEHRYWNGDNTEVEEVEEEIRLGSKTFKMCVSTCLLCFLIVKHMHRTNCLIFVQREGAFIDEIHRTTRKCTTEDTGLPHSQPRGEWGHLFGYPIRKKKISRKCFVFWHFSTSIRESRLTRADKATGGWKYWCHVTPCFRPHVNDKRAVVP